MVSEWQLVLWWCGIKIPPPVGNRVKRGKGVLLPNLVERKQGDGIKEKLVKDLYDIFSYGEGVREALPKNLFLQAVAILILLVLRLSQNKVPKTQLM